MRTRIIEMRKGIEKGESLLRVSKSSELFSNLVLQMVAVGEETGRLEPLLDESADYYEREVDFDLKSLTAKIEPILIETSMFEDPSKGSIITVYERLELLSVNCNSSSSSHPIILMLFISFNASFHFPNYLFFEDF